jgi:hypothetical protein
MKIIQLVALTTALSTGLGMAQTTPSTSKTQATTPATQATTPSTPSTAKPATAKPAPAPPPSASDIAAAKTKNMVWVNLNTKVYHSSKDKEYGTTKNGKFMTEADAKAAGYKIAKS